jgi:hypothetical protein
MYSIRGALIAAESRATMFALRAACIVGIYTEAPKKAGITTKDFLKQISFAQLWRIHPCNAYQCFQCLKGQSV